MLKSVNLDIEMTMASSHVLHTHPEMFYLIASEGNCAIITVNDAFKDYVSHIKPQSFSDIVGVDTELEDVQKALQKSKKNKPEPVKFYCQVRGKNGILKFVEWYVWSYSGLYHFSGQRMVDATNRTAIEAERLEAMLEDFKHALEHDLGQPITSLSRIVSLILQEADDKERTSLLRLLEETNNKIVVAWNDISNRVHRKLR